MTGQWHPALLLWLAVAVGAVAVADDALTRLRDRVAEWWAEWRADRELVRCDTEREARARALANHPAGRNGGAR